MNWLWVKEVATYKSLTEIDYMKVDIAKENTVYKQWQKRFLV